MSSDMYPGRRLSYAGHLCTVRYVGEVQGTTGLWLGVEWDDPARGKHSGEHSGIKYFESRHKSPTSSSFIRLTRIPDTPRTFVEALRHKYAADTLERFFPNIVEYGKPLEGSAAALVKEKEKAIRISGKEVEEVGFDKIRRRLAALEELKIVLLDGLCITRQVSAFRSREDKIAELLSETDVKTACPKVIQLDLSRNLFEEWREIAQIAIQLSNLKHLRVDENRFRDISLTADEQTRYGQGFMNIHTLTLNDTLMSWSEITAVASLFTNLAVFSASHNAFTRLHTTLLPLTVVDLTLEDNGFRTLADLWPLTQLPRLKRLVLKHNSIHSIRDRSNSDPLKFPVSLTEVDLSHNSISSWSFIDSLPSIFPSLASLRVSHNPLYHGLRSPEDRPLSAEDGYMLTIARVGQLNTLNFSCITPKERLNAEIYYLSSIAKELSLHPEDQASFIVARHPRYSELCEEYGEPVIERNNSSINPNSLAARLITFNFHLGESARALVSGGISAEFSAELPKNFTVYNALGTVGKRTGLPPLKLRLFWETGEFDPVAKVAHDYNDLLGWKSENEEDEDEDGTESIPAFVPREVELLAGTRLVGTWVDAKVASVRVEVNDMVLM